MPNSDSIRTAFLSDLGNASAETRRTRLFWLDKWLSFMGNKPLQDWNKAAVLDFQKKLQKDGYAISTANYGLSVVQKAFVIAQKVHDQERNNLIASVDSKNPNALVDVLKAINAQGPSWEMGRNWLPEVQREAVQHPAIPMEDLKKQIDAAKSGKLEPVETAFLALASVYGMRKCELIAVEPQHIDYQAGTIWIDTHKHGEKRNQLLVPEIVPYLKQYDFKLQYNDGQLWWMFVHICRKSGMEVPKRQHESWHSYRRRTETEIMNELSGDHTLKAPAEILVRRWLRWKISKITELYYTNEEADKIVMEHHPIRSMWR